MKIVMINGQNHKGSSYHIGRMVADKISDAEITEIFLPRDLNHFCLGCYACIDDPAKCPFYEEKNRIMEAVEAADILIFTTPLYCLRASGPMESFLDLTFNYWMVHRPRECMFTKKAVIVSTAAGSPSKGAIKDIKNALFNWGVPFILSCAMPVQAMNWQGVSENKKSKIDKITTKLANRIMKKRQVKPGIKTKGLFMMMRMLQKGGMGSGEAERAYWEEKGWLGAKRPWK